jgi:hypothetical protein
MATVDDDETAWSMVACQLSQGWQSLALFTTRLGDAGGSVEKHSLGVRAPLW